jgi:hypothetical protein
MVLIFEDGSGVPGSNSYLEQSGVVNLIPISYQDKWNALTSDEKDEYIITASLFIDGSFNWIGTQHTAEQGLSWPRDKASFQGHYISGVPYRIKMAATRAVQLMFDEGLPVFNTTREDQIKKEKLGPMENEFFENKRDGQVETKYDFINNLLRGLYIKTSGNVITADVERS